MTRNEISRERIKKAIIFVNANPGCTTDDFRKHIKDTRGIANHALSKARSEKAIRSEKIILKGNIYDTVEKGKITCIWFPINTE